MTTSQTSYSSAVYTDTNVFEVYVTDVHTDQGNGTTTSEPKVILAGDVHDHLLSKSEALELAQVLSAAALALEDE